MLQSLDRLLEPLSALVLVAALFAAAAQRAESRLRTCTAQSAALSLWLLVFAVSESRLHLYLLAVVGFGVKCLLVPRLMAATEPVRSRPEPHDGPGGALSLVAAGALAAGARWLLSAVPTASLPSRDAIAAGLASVLAGLFLVAMRRRARAQATGLLVIENGVVLAAVAVSGTRATTLLVLGLEAVLVGLLLLMRAPRMAEGIELAEKPQVSEGGA